MRRFPLGIGKTMTRIVNTAADAAVTLILWVHYVAGFLLIFSPFYLGAFLFAADREAAFQRLNHALHRSFFTLLRFLVPGVTWHISPEVLALRSAVIVANHQSFLDPILFVSLFPRQKTVVKKRYFRVPVFGWILKTSGYIPALAGDTAADILLEQIGRMKAYLAAGGNLFMFPEGTRSRDGRVAPFERGAFRLAKLCRAPVRVVTLSGTGRLYGPGRFLFRTRERFTVSVDLAGTLQPDYDGDVFPLSGLMDVARDLMERRETP